MRKKSLGVIFASVVAFIVCQQAAAQTTYLSNLSQTDGNAIAVRGNNGAFGENQDAAGFTTGNTALAYQLNSVVISIFGSINNPAPGFVVAIYTNNSGQPGSLLGTLSGSNSPSTAGEYTYTAAGITLSALTPYWVVVTGTFTASDANTFYLWNTTQSSTYTSTGGWTIQTGTVPGSDDGGATWHEQQEGFTPVFAINASAVPEPATFALALIGGATLLARRFARRQS